MVQKSEPLPLHQILNHTFSFPIFLFLPSLMYGTGINPEIITLEVLLSNLSHNSLNYLCTHYPFPTDVICVNVHIVRAAHLSLENVLQSPQDPGVLFSAIKSLGHLDSDLAY